MSATTRNKSFDWTIIAPWVFGLGMFAIWEGAVWAFKIAPFVLPAPTKIAEAIVQYWPGRKVGPGDLDRSTTVRLHLILDAIPILEGVAIKFVFITADNHHCLHV